MLCTLTREAIIITEFNTHSINVHLYDRIKTGTPNSCMNFLFGFRSIKCGANHGWCLPLRVLLDAIKSRKRHATCIIIIITYFVFVIADGVVIVFAAFVNKIPILFDEKKVLFPHVLQADIIMWVLILRRKGNKLRLRNSFLSSGMTRCDLFKFKTIDSVYTGETWINSFCCISLKSFDRKHKQQTQLPSEYLRDTHPHADAHNTNRRQHKHTHTPVWCIGFFHYYSVNIIVSSCLICFSNRREILLFRASKEKKKLSNDGSWCELWIRAQLVSAIVCSPHKARLNVNVSGNGWRQIEGEREWEPAHSRQ